MSAVRRLLLGTTCFRSSTGRAPEFRRRALQLSAANAAALSELLQVLSCGEALPLAHFVRSARGVLLKGYGSSEVLTATWLVVIFTCLAACAAVVFYRRRVY